MDLTDKNVLITGGARGIGLALAKLCAAEGARVLLVDTSGADLSQAVQEITQAGGQAYPFVHDVTDRDGCYALERRITREIGPVHVLVNNAGVVHKGHFLEGNDEAWTHTVDVNLGGMMWMMRAFMPGMVSRGDGHVVNLASLLGYLPAGGAAVYSATKHAVIGLTEAVRFELLERGIRGVTLTTACPGFTATAMFTGVKTPLFFSAVTPDCVAKALHKAIRKRTPIMRYPRRLNLMPIFYALMPHRLWVVGTRRFGAHRAMESHHALPNVLVPALSEGQASGREREE